MGQVSGGPTVTGGAQGYAPVPQGSVPPQGTGYAGYTPAQTGGSYPPAGPVYPPATGPVYPPAGPVTYPPQPMYPPKR